MANPNQARDEDGKWTKAYAAARLSAGVVDEKELNYQVAQALFEYWQSGKQLSPELQKHFDQLRMPDNMTNLEWAKQTATEGNINRTIKDSAGILTEKDRVKLERIAELNDGMLYPYKVEKVERIDFDPFGASMKEWGYDSPYQLRPTDLMAVGNWKPPTAEKPYWTIRIVELPRISNRETFWHEFSHTLSDHIVAKIAGVHAETTKGDWHDLFAINIEKEW